MSASDEAHAATMAQLEPSLASPDEGRIEAAARSAHELLAGRWEVLGLLGKGGMGAVYRARDRELGEVVALKMLHVEGLDAEMLERFRQEVRLSRKVTHKNVARVYDLGEHHGERFFTMELVDGDSLRAVLSRDGAMAPSRVVELGVAMCRGLAAAHEVGVVHRDLKPDNVLISRDGRIAITDFGIASSLEPGTKASETTSFAGTPMYMAPEQVDRSSPIDVRSDIYALGVVLFELLTGRGPWDGATPLALAVARLTQPPPDPRRLRPVPDALAELVLQCMARAPEDRPASAEQVEAALASALPALDAGTVALPRSIRPPSLSQPAPTPTSSPRSALSPAPSSLGPAHGHTLSPWSIARPGERLVRLAILPLSNVGKADDAYLAEGLTDDLIDAVTSLRGLRVTARALVARYAGQRDLDLRAVGEELGVDVLAEGSLRRLPDARLRFSLRLIGASDCLQIWAKRFDVQEAELLHVNDTAAKAIADALTLEAPRGDRQLSDPVAVELYLRARALYRNFTPNNLEEAIRLYEQALERVPDDPVLLAGSAMALARLDFFDGGLAARSLAAAERALAVAPSSGEAHLALATVHLQRGRAAEALSEGLAALAHSPTLAEAHQLVGRVLAETGPLELALRSLDLAAELDPSAAYSHRERLRVLSLMGRWDAASRALDDCAARTTSDERMAHLLARARFAAWRRDRVGLEAARADMLTEAQRFEGVSAERAEIGKRLWAQLDVARPMPRFEEVDPSFASAYASPRRRLYFAQLSAEICALAGDEEVSWSWVERAVSWELLDLAWLDACPLLEPLRTKPGWADLRAPVAARAAEVHARLERR
jgi:eukaryotic-like serine/threonine-protein kinase